MADRKRKRLDLKLPYPGLLPEPERLELESYKSTLLTAKDQLTGMYKQLETKLSTVSVKSLERD